MELCANGFLPGRMILRKFHRSDEGLRRWKLENRNSKIGEGRSSPHLFSELRILRNIGESRSETVGS